MMKAQELAGELKDRGPRSKKVQDERLLNLHFRNAKEGILLTSGSTYFATRNGGKKWKAVSLPDFTEPKNACFQGEVGWIVCDRGWVFKIK